MQNGMQLISTMVNKQLDAKGNLVVRKPPLPNSGRVKAMETAKFVGSKAVFPQFTSEKQGSEFTDFANLKKSVTRSLPQLLTQWNSL